MAKVLVSLDDELLARIDRAAAEARLSRSAYLARLAARELDSAGPGAKPSVRRALERLDKLFARNPTPGGDSTALIRADRDSR